MKLNLLVASGGVLSHAPRMHQTAMMLIDAFQPEGITTLAKDSIFMMPHLGVLTQVHSKAAMEVFERDCLIYLGTVISPKGTGKTGKLCFNYAVKGESIDKSGTISVGDLKLLPLDIGKTAEIIIEPAKGFDAGSGQGKHVTKIIKGGTVGLILDGRGRPLDISNDQTNHKSILNNWVNNLDLYPETEKLPELINEKPSTDKLKSAQKAHAYTPGSHGESLYQYPAKENFTGGRRSLGQKKRHSGTNTGCSRNFYAWRSDPSKYI